MINLKFLADIRNRIGKKEICEAIEMVGLDPKAENMSGNIRWE